MQVAFFYSILNPRPAGVLGRARSAGVEADPVPLPNSQTSGYSEVAIESFQRVLFGGFKKYLKGHSQPKGFPSDEGGSRI